MSQATNGKLVSCYQCAGVLYCFGTWQPELQRHNARSRAASCSSPHKGFTTEIVTVVGYPRGYSRANAEKLVLHGLARWCGHKTIAAVGELPAGVQRRLTRGKKEKKVVPSPGC